MTTTIKSQFARIETHAIKASKSKPTNPPKDWKPKTTAEGACGEAERLEQFSKHVEGEKSFDVIYGMNPMQLYQKIKTRFKEIKKAGTWIKDDQAVLVSGVLSYPAEEMDENFYPWLVDCQAFLTEKYGDKLHSIVVHYDESHPHLHFFCANLDNLSVYGLDPAKTARKDEETKRKTFALEGVEYKPKMSAQKSALSAWLDEVYMAISQKYDHARQVGARKARLHGSPREVKRKLALDAKEKELQAIEQTLANREADAKVRNDSYLRMAKRLREQIVEVDSQSKAYKGLMEKLQVEVSRLEKEGDLHGAVVLAGKINTIRNSSPLTSKKPRASLS